MLFSKCQGTRSHSPLNWVFPHLSCYNLSYETRKTASRRRNAWKFIPHSTAYFTILIAFNCFFFSLSLCNVTFGMSGQNVFIAKYVLLFSSKLTDEVSEISRLCAFPQHVVHLKRNRSLQTGCNKCVKSGRPVILTTVFADCGRLAKCVFIHLKFLLVH